MANRIVGQGESRQAGLEARASPGFTPEPLNRMDTVPDIPGVARAIDGLDVELLRAAIQEEYSLVATEPHRGFHFHTGRPLARLLGYDAAWLERIPEPTISSFAGTGNPFSMGVLQPGERVVDVGCGAGIDSLIAAEMVGSTGQVVGIDMTPDMLQRARASAARMGLQNVDFRRGYAEELPYPDGSA